MRQLLWLLLLAACSMPQVAQACITERDVRYYFLRPPPEVTADVMFVQVTIVSRTNTHVEARLEGRFAVLSDDGMIHIVLPEPPLGANCIDWGDINGPVYVVASSAIVRDGNASIMAKPVRAREASDRQELTKLRRNANIWIDPDYVAGRKPVPDNRPRPEWWGTAATLRPYNRDPSSRP